MRRRRRQRAFAGSTGQHTIQAARELAYARAALDLASDTDECEKRMGFLVVAYKRMGRVARELENLPESTPDDLFHRKQEILEQRFERLYDETAKLCVVKGRKVR